MGWDVNNLRLQIVQDWEAIAVVRRW